MLSSIVPGLISAGGFDRGLFFMAECGVYYCSGQEVTYPCWYDVEKAGHNTHLALKLIFDL